MNGGQDLGGLQGFGPVVPVPGQPDYDTENYHAAWEPRAMAMVVAIGACGQWNIDQSRHARENRPAGEYITSPYYKIWTEGLSTLLLERGMVTEDELKKGKLTLPPIQVKGCLSKEAVWSALHSLAGAADRTPTAEPKFAVGDEIATKNINPRGHTRLPRYARAKSGIITKVLGCHAFPDKTSKGNEIAHWLYQTRFSAQELWGEEANPADSVTLDLWEPYFEA